MFSKILNNNFALIGIIIVLVGLILVGIEFGPDIIGDTPDKIVVDTTSSNPNYQKIRAEIEDFSKLKWDNNKEYDRLNNKIKSNASEKIINESESNGLKGILVGKYLHQLKDTSEQFCRFGKDRSVLQNIEKEVNLFKDSRPDDTKGTLETIQSFYGALNQCGSIMSYTSKDSYREGTSNSYESTIKDYQLKDFIIDNKFIQDQITNCISRLKQHKVHASRYEERSQEDDCDCATEYKGYDFYVKACEEIQKNR